MELKILDTGNIELDNVYIGVDDEHITSKRLHFHPYWELKVYEIGDSVHLVMNPPNHVHGYTPYSVLCNGFTLHCQQPILNLSFFNNNELTEDYYFPWETVDSLCPGGLTVLIESIVQAKAKYADGRFFNALLATLLAAIQRGLQSQDEHPFSSSLTDRAKYYIERNYYKPSLSVESVAASVGVTAGHLANLFKKEGLPTLRKYIVHIRMEHAMRLLKSRCYTVKEVADMTGWSCQFYFSNCFRKQYGVAPSRFTG